MIKHWNRSLVRYKTLGPFDALPDFLGGMKNPSPAVQFRKCFVSVEMRNARRQGVETSLYFGLGGDSWIRGKFVQKG